MTENRKTLLDMKFDPETYQTEGGVKVTKIRKPRSYDDAISTYITALDSRRGAAFASNYEYPGRYTRWDTAIIDPPLGISSRGRKMSIEAYNERGQALISILLPVLSQSSEITIVQSDDVNIVLNISEPDRQFTEEERSKMPTVFSALRLITKLFHSDEDSNLGLFGSFGYDLAFQFDPIDYTIERPDDQRDLVLFLPDEILMVDHHATDAWVESYEFSLGDITTAGKDRTVEDHPFVPSDITPPKGDHVPGEYAKLVDKAKESFKRGDLFEVVPGQMFFEKCNDKPSDIARRLKKINPSPYSFFINLGKGEYLVGASPEMFVRVNGRRIETCPISGTIKRGKDAIEDSERILELLNSKKDESELTMCSDVDRNDKSRVCEPGSVRMIGRRQIEMYSRLIHTVDHIEGRLRDGMDAFDGFLSHAWAVTVTGAPKLWAMRFIEKHEKSPRSWYGGAVGMINFNGDMNTGLTLRTIRIKDGIAEVRAGATLLFDSDPDAEEAETELKASAMLAAIRGATASNDPSSRGDAARVGEGASILLVDHEDSFVHTLANYFRQTGAKVSTVRSPISDRLFDELKPDLVVLSPGPGNPSDFDCRKTITSARSRDIPIFGVCLGMQALAEAAGGTLRQLAVPMHGKPSRIMINGNSMVFSGIENNVAVGRYHSLFVDPVTLPDNFVVTAETDDGVVMGMEDKSGTMAAVQFHPESIMSLGQDAGMRMIENVIAHMVKRK
jgi:anthranilate synthase